MVLLQLTVTVSMILDIPIARQVLGFVYFTFVPGYVFLKILRLDNLDKIETLIFSVGSSLVFLMLVGLAINEIFTLAGFSNPLSSPNLLVILSSVIFIGYTSTYLRSRGTASWRPRMPKLTYPHLLMLLPLALSIVGVVSVNVFGSNLVLLLMILSVAFLVALAILARRVLPQNLYPPLLLMIAISLLFHSSLVSKYLINFGSDISLEYAIAKVTTSDALWSPLGNPAAGRFDSMLSITILPAIYSNLLNLTLTWTFKILYPVIFSLVPLGLYLLWKKYIGSKGAFIAAFLVVAQETFYGEMLGLARQMIAEVFLVLLLLTLLSIKMETPKRVLLFSLFGVGLVMSHYALTLIFAFFIGFVLVFLLLIRRPSAKITVSMVLIFLVLMFSWYIYTSKAATFNDILTYGDYVYSQLGQFFNLESRGATVLSGLGLEAAPTVWNTISRVFAYLTEFLIIVGFLALLIRKVKGDFDREYLALSAIAVVFLGALVVVPGLAKTFNMTRFYHVLLFFLAPLFVLGGVALNKLTSKRESEIRTLILLLLIVIPYFLFQTSFVFETTRAQSWSLALSGYRMSNYYLYYKFGYISDQTFASAQWMKENSNLRYTAVYADRSSSALLISYGSVNIGEVMLLSNTTDVLGISANGTIYVSQLNGTIYLGPLNVVDGIILGQYGGDYHVYNTTELTYLNNMNRIYSDGESQILKTP